MNPDGSGQQRLTGDGSQPNWSPDGRKIAFGSERDGNADIYVMNADGSGQQRLTRNPASDHSADWSPDGRKIVFVSDRAGRHAAYVMNADGSGQRKLTRTRPVGFSFMQATRPVTAATGPPLPPCEPLPQGSLR